MTLICAIFHDIEDGPELGRIIAAALLAAFREQFGVSLAKVGGGTPHINLNEFDPFHARIPTVVRGLRRAARGPRPSLHRRSRGARAAGSLQGFFMQPPPVC